MEVWKQVRGYEGLYEVSNMGNVKSLTHTDRLNRVHNGRVLKPQLHNKGYLQLMLCKDGEKKRKYIHRLVAEAFVENPNPQKYTEINHIDENKQNNIAENIEWCYHKYNMRHGTLHKRKADKCVKPVIARNVFTGETVEYRSQTDAAKELGIPQSAISTALRKKRKNGEPKVAYCRIWEYKEVGHEA